MKILAFIILSFVLVIITALFGTLFIYAGWNWGLTPALSGQVKEIDFGTAFWLGIFISTIAGMFKSKIESKGD